LTQQRAPRFELILWVKIFSADDSQSSQQISNGEITVVELKGYRLPGNYGRMGSFTASNLVMNFGNRQVTNQLPISVNLAPNAAVTVNSAYFIPAQSWSMNPGFHNLTGVTIACTPTCPGATAAAVNGGFIGAQGQGYLLGTQAFNSQLKTGLPSASTGGNVSVYAKQ